MNYNNATHDTENTTALNSIEFCIISFLSLYPRHMASSFYTLSSHFCANFGQLLPTTGLHINSVVLNRRRRSIAYEVSCSSTVPPTGGFPLNIPARFPQGMQRVFIPLFSLPLSSRPPEPLFRDGRFIGPRYESLSAPLWRQYRTKEVLWLEMAFVHRLIDSSRCGFLFLLEECL